MAFTVQQRTPDHPGVRDFLRQPDKAMLIGGQWQTATSGNRIEAHDPATGQLIATAPAGDRLDIDRAVVAARTAFEEGPWTDIMPAKRATLLWRLADLIEANAEELAQLESYDQGKPLSHARSEMVGVAGQYRYFAGMATKIEGQTFSQSMNRHNPPGRQALAYSSKEPIGVVGIIVPWNAPLILLSFKLAPALAAGCSVVVKPAEQTPLSSLRFGELFTEAGFPPGVVNIVTGYGTTAGAALAGHPDVDMISFTGSTVTGRAILEGAKSNLKKVSLELGGKSPIVVLPDADLDSTVSGVIRAITYNSGQICIAGSRLYAHRSIFNTLLDAVAEQFAALRLGHGLHTKTQVGPMVNRPQADRVKGYIDGAVEAGANVFCGGAQQGPNNTFIQPTLLTDTRQDMACVQEEIFGPVLACQPYDNYNEIIPLANDSKYGLGASIWTTNISDAHRVAGAIRAGVVWINTHNLFDPAFPMGGYKESGWSRDSGSQAVDNFLQSKTVIAVI